MPDFHSIVSGPVKVDRFIESGDTIHLDDDLGLAVLHTPGHSPGSTSFHLPADNALFSGDAVPEIGHLLASWDGARTGDDANRATKNGLMVIQRFHSALRRVLAGEDRGEDVCRQVVTELGLPPAVLPVVARTCKAHLAVAGRADLLAGE